MWQISRKSSWKQASWGDKGRKNAYKRGGGCYREGVGKYWEKNTREEQERESYRSLIEPSFTLAFFAYSLYLGKTVYVSLNNILSIFYS